MPMVIIKLTITAIEKPFAETKFLEGFFRRTVPLTKNKVTNQERKAI